MWRPGTRDAEAFRTVHCEGNFGAPRSWLGRSTASVESATLPKRNVAGPVSRNRLMTFPGDDPVGHVLLHPVHDVGSVSAFKQNLAAAMGNFDQPADLRVGLHYDRGYEVDPQARGFAGRQRQIESLAGFRRSRDDRCEIVLQHSQAQRFDIAQRKDVEMSGPKNMGHPHGVTQSAHVSDRCAGLCQCIGSLVARPVPI